MTIQVALEHRTEYTFDRRVELAPHVVRLRPAPHCRTPIVAYSLRVEPGDHFLNWQQDPFGNFEARLVFPEPATKLSITVDLIADMTVINPFDFFLEASAEEVPFAYDAALADDLEPYRKPLPLGRLLGGWLDGVDRSRKRTIDFLVELNQRLAADIDYSIRMEPGVQTPEETLASGVGSCRDSAWLLVQILRHLGYAARFVSGYLVQLTADQAPLEGPSGPEADFTDLHAWTEVFLPGAGWVGLDPTSGLFAGEGHIPLAATPSPAAAAPITGATGVCEVTFDFSNTVIRSHEDPRVTLPYDDAQWAAIDALGRAVDERLIAGDVRLTMGGEPTFVSIDDMVSDEWNTVADGFAKRVLADELTRRLVEAFAPKGVVHRGQGKWYPGEPLPRWQNAITWRTDGVPLWHDHDLLADPSTPGTSGQAEAGAVVRGIARRLGLSGCTIRAAHEDVLYALWERASRPPTRPGTPEDRAAEDLGPDDPRLATEDSRDALTDEFDALAGHPTGWVLPLHRNPGARPPWVSSGWRTRRKALFLLAGDSPMGYRLPIRSLGADLPPAFEPSPFAQLRPFPDRPGAPGDGPFAEEVLVDDPSIPPTALCVEERGGHVHVFLPPLLDPIHAVELLGVIEATAQATSTPVVIEGYPLPADPRLSTLGVAPDPGVIEVNVHPAGDWDELRTITETVHDAARRTRLGTEKFDLDGTHTGTGGGNHLTLGGPTAADSPLLRRPDLLRSLVTYWQHHPSLSYLFSGRFIGPSSQAPRVDEARDDRLYELETAFAEIDRLGGTPAPWMVDRLLRHLLTDLTGNTHRAEFCIDKLFSPDSERGRLGLLELRGFEMPPHPQMALAQALLVRAIVARCWEDPYRHRPVRWGTMLHDRYLLPHFAEADIGEVVDDLAAHGIDFDRSWIDPFLEFRFPRHGTATVAGVTFELRGAIEPWHVLGEEATGSGMARYVDSSVERLQLRVDGLAEGRHVVTCNGAPLPLVPTGEAGAWVAGVRYKAWAPPSGLHPTLPIDSPLTFDLVDTATGRSRGGCRYHVVHPGGLSYEHPPVNAVEAESRRQRRLEPMGHTPGRVDVAVDRVAEHREYPATLDLRR